MGFTWITEKQRREQERQEHDAWRVVARADWVRIARDAALRREGLLPKEPTNEH